MSKFKNALSKTRQFFSEYGVEVLYSAGTVVVIGASVYGYHAYLKSLVGHNTLDSLIHNCFDNGAKIFIATPGENGSLDFLFNNRQDVADQVLSSLKDYVNA